jgi:hypothetical protein
VNIPYLNCFWFVFCGGGKVLAGFDEVVLWGNVDRLDGEYISWY